MMIGVIVFDSLWKMKKFQKIAGEEVLHTERKYPKFFSIFLLSSLSLSDSDGENSAFEDDYNR